MTFSKRFQYTSQLLWGALLLIFGTVLLLDNLDVIYMGSIWSYWPFLLVAVGVGKFLQAERPSEQRDGAWWIFIGLWLYISIFEVFGFGFRESWPMLIVAWGIGIVWKSFDQQRIRSKKEHAYEQV